MKLASYVHDGRVSHARLFDDAIIDCGWFLDGFGEAGVPVRIPEVVNNFDYKGELATVIGVGGRGIPAGMDTRMSRGTRVTTTSASGTGRGAPREGHSKSLCQHRAFGAAVAGIDESGAVEDLVLETRLNGEIRQ